MPQGLAFCFLKMGKKHGFFLLWLPIMQFGGIIPLSVMGCESMKRYDAVLFDVDGTLIHSAPGILYTLQKTFEAMGTDIGGVDLMRYVGPPLRRTFGEYYADTSDIERAVTVYRGIYREQGRHMCALYDGVPQMLKSLSDGGVLLYTATSKPVQVVEPMLEELGIAGFFRQIGGASMDAARDTKTAVIRSILSLPALDGMRVLMVGDRADDMAGAAECFLPAAAAAYGYGAPAEWEPFCPVYVAKDCRALTQFVLDGEMI